MPPTANELQNYRNLLRITGTHVRNAVLKGKEKVKKVTERRHRAKTRNLLKKLGKI